jgi:hypothetical protein
MTQMSRRHAIITGDLLRAMPDFSFHQRGNVRWLTGLLRTPLERIGYQVSTLGAHDDDFPFSDLCATAYSNPGDDIISKWAHMFDGPMSGSVRDFIGEYFQSATIFLFEASPTITSFINEIDGIYVNFRIHPLRFGSDLIMTMESNDRCIMNRMRNYEIPSDIIDAEIASLRARWANRPTGIHNDSLIFLGQTRHDASIIVNGEFMSLTRSADNLNALASGRPVFHKPHPHDLDAPMITQWLKIFPESQELQTSTYNIIASQQKMEFVTISSGAGYEAELLGYKVNFLNPRNWGKNSGVFSHFVSVLHEYWYPSFWKYVLLGEPVSQSPAAACFVPDRLRRVIGMEWAKR